MPERRLTAYLGGRRAGWFTQVGGKITFEFDETWAQTSNRLELSVSMPKSRIRHTGRQPENYLWGLLPDNEGVLQRWGYRFSENPQNAMALLAHVGLDTAGAIQLTEEDSPTLSIPGHLKPMTTAGIAEQLRQLRADPNAWMLSADSDGSFSLAGAQAKFALAKTDTGWALPLGSAASTHIFKPGAYGFTRQDINEHLCLDASARLGLETARSEIVDFEGESAIVVDRYDRLLENGQVVRVHQEDLLQAAGLHPRLKYQNDGGPGIVDCSKLIAQNVLRSESKESVGRFFDANIYNWIVSGTDAHAKNYSLLHTAQGASFAPLYDIASSLPYPELSPRKVKFAMAISGHYRVWEINEEYLVRQAVDIGIDPETAHDRIEWMRQNVASAFIDAAENSGLADADRTFALRLAERVASRASSLVSTAPARTSRAAVRRSRVVGTQPRAKDIGQPGNGGRFASRQRAETQSRTSEPPN
jgi:serine/threonine-protein kinase HipA